LWPFVLRIFGGGGFLSLPPARERPSAKLELPSKIKPALKRGPRGLVLVHEDKDLLVVEKPAGLLTIGSEHDKTRTVHFLLNDYVCKGDPKSRHRVYVVHRLDQETSGLLLFAKSEKAKNFLQQHWEQVDKYYLALLHGQLAVKEGLISSYLVENAAHRVYSTKDPVLGKLARLTYQVKQEGGRTSLVKIHLLTGRKHQIRVQFADLGHPLVGDKKYANGTDGAKRLALHACSLSFIHPHHGRKMLFESGLPEDFRRMLGSGPEMKDVL
jgi:tRNA pseudouridine32 synthase/23S rRNA pseudouridine746 synthase/23S rRNA pseudouridine1911/1915/1917 synthase